MTKFIDGKNQEWILRATVGNLEDLKKDSGIDLKSIFQSSLQIHDFINDFERLTTAAKTMIGVTPNKENFVDAIGADQLDTLADAVFDEAVAMVYRRELRETASKAIREDLARICRTITANMQEVKTDG